MKTVFLVLAAGIISGSVYAQVDSTISFNQLQVPSSPAFNLLGIAPNSIERPKNPTDFALSISNASAGFTSFPQNFAVEIAPYWVFGGRNTSFNDFISDKNIGKNILQTATVSFGTAKAVSAVDLSEFQQVGIALKFSLCRGRAGDEYKRWSDAVSLYLAKDAAFRAAAYDSLINNDTLLSSYLTLVRETADKNDNVTLSLLQNLINQRHEQLELKADELAGRQHQVIDSLKKLAEQTDFKRYGFKMDWAMGAVMDYPDSNFQKCYVSKAAAWLTLGFEKEKSLNMLGVFRFTEAFNRFYLNDAGDLVENVNMGEFDYGLRLYQDLASKLTLSFEYLQRFMLVNKGNFSRNNISLPDNTNRYVFSASYKVGKNQNLSFTYGKDFDNHITKESNVIAALSFLIGLGSERPFLK